MGVPSWQEPGTGPFCLMVAAGFSGRWMQGAGCLEPTYPRREKYCVAGTAEGDALLTNSQAISSGRCSQEALSPPLQSILRVYSLF